MTCALCRRSQEDGFRKIRCKGIDHVDECPTGEVPKLLPGNRRFWEICRAALPGLFDGFGGVNYLAISYIMDLYGVPEGQRPIVHDKFLAVVKGIDEIKEQERKRGQ